MPFTGTSTDTAGSPACPHTAGPRSRGSSPPRQNASTAAAAAAPGVAAAGEPRRVDLAIANAGTTGGLPGDGSGESLADVHRLMGINSGGVCNTLHPLTPAMRRRRRGQLALMSSLAA